MSETPDPTITDAVVGSLRVLQLGDVDAAASRLAYAYAQAIDEAGADVDTLNALGPKLLSALDALGMTPKARAAIVRGEADAQPPSPRARTIAELRNRSDAREH